jgi:predicted GNAT superfamily acetyltransferase
VQKTPTNTFTYVDDIVVARKKKRAYISNLEKNIHEYA